MQRIEVTTHFDCTKTGTTSYRKIKTGNPITTVEEWDFSRNQQRNFETILQCASLRANPQDITDPVSFTTEEGDKYWKFSFCISHDGSFSNGDDPTGLLKESVNGVPMITGLDETYKEGFLMPYLIATGENPNVYFDLVQDAM